MRISGSCQCDKVSRLFLVKRIAVWFAVSFGTIAVAQDIPIGVTYLCNGEHIYVENCNIRDLSDNANCMVAHPDKLTPTGLNSYTYLTRGALKKLLPTCQQPSAKQLAAAKAFQQKQQDAYNAAVAKANPQPTAPNLAAANQANANAALPPPPKTPEERAMRRCVSSGRLASTCTGNSLLGAFGQMVSQVLPGADKDPAPGPTMAGVFQGAGGWRLDFIDQGVLVNCSDLSPNQQGYSLDLKNGRTILTINTAPKPLVLSVRGDGTIVGSPGPVTIDGVIASGYVAGHSNGTQHDIYGNEYDSAGNRAYGSTPGYSTFSPKRVTCPAINLTSKGAGVGVQTMETDLLKNMLGGDKGPPTPSGIRMRGIYAASSGFSVQFFPESALLGCGPDSARAYPYTVTAGGTGAVVKIDAPDHPLTLAFKADGALDPGGAGSYQVHGRIVTGQNDNGDFIFVPFETTCNLAVLAPSKQIPATGGANATMTASAETPGGAANLSTPAAPLGNATLSIVSGFPTTPGAQNALAGHPLVLLRTSYADALAKGGISVPSGTSPYLYVGTACVNKTPDCQKMLDAVKAQAASAVRANIDGRGTFPGVPPGTYYLMISTRYNNQALTWGQAVELKAGPNTFTLNAQNATPLQ